MAATDDEAAAALAAHRFFDVYIEPDPAVTDAAKEELKIISRKLAAMQAADLGPVSYTHLDVYKRQVGVLHSLSGTMAISESTLKDTVLMLIEQQNAKGGVLGRQLEAVVVDPASDWPLFAEKTRELLTVDKVDVIFGCWTSVSRKSALPVLEELNGLLFYPVQYEGEESSKNVFYTGAAPNQQAIPTVEMCIRDSCWSLPRLPNTSTYPWRRASG